jgi:hypothetical protein
MGRMVLKPILMKLGTDPHSDDFINPPPLCKPIFLDK